MKKCERCGREFKGLTKKLNRLCTTCWVESENRKVEIRNKQFLERSVK